MAGDLHSMMARAMSFQGLHSGFHLPVLDSAASRKENCNWMCRTQTAQDRTQPSALISQTVGTSRTYSSTWTPFLALFTSRAEGLRLRFPAGKLLLTLCPSPEALPC